MKFTRKQILELRSNAMITDIHIQVPVENVEPLCKALDPALLMMQTTCQSIREADDLLASAIRWTAKRD